MGAPYLLKCVSGYCYNNNNNNNCKNPFYIRRPLRSQPGPKTIWMKIIIEKEEQQKEEQQQPQQLKNI